MTAQVLILRAVASQWRGGAGIMWANSMDCEFCQTAEAIHLAVPNTIGRVADLCDACLSHTDGGREKSGERERAALARPPAPNLERKCNVF